MWECLEIGNMLQELRQEEWDEPLMEATQVIVCDLLNRHATAHKYGGEIIHLYLKRTIGKKRGYMQFYIPVSYTHLWAKEFFNGNGICPPAAFKCPPPLKNSFAHTFTGISPFERKDNFTLSLRSVICTETSISSMDNGILTNPSKSPSL